MPTFQHSALTGANLHEPKGITSATSDEVYAADGAGSGTWKTSFVSGWEKYVDVTTQTTPIALTLANTQYELTNDGAGSGTSVTYKLPGKTALWDTSTNRFDFSSLSVGDSVDITISITPTTSGANHNLILEANFAIGGTSPYSVALLERQIKSSSSNQFVNSYTFPITDDDMKNNPASLTLKSDSTGDTVSVNSFMIRVIPHKIIRS